MNIRSGYEHVLYRNRDGPCGRSRRRPTVLESVGEGLSRWILRMDYKMKISLQHWRSSGGRRGFSVELGSHLAGWGLLTSGLDLNMRSLWSTVWSFGVGLGHQQRQQFNPGFNRRLARGPSELHSYWMARVIVLSHGTVVPLERFDRSFPPINQSLPKQTASLVMWYPSYRAQGCIK